MDKEDAPNGEPPALPTQEEADPPPAPSVLADKVPEDDGAAQEAVDSYLRQPESPLHRCGVIQGSARAVNHAANIDEAFLS